MKHTILSGPEALTEEWLTDILRHSTILRDACVTHLVAEPLGEGLGFMGRLVRIHFECDVREVGVPPSVIAKFPTTLGENRELCRFFRFYERELAFYERLAPSVPVRVPRCLHQTIDPETQDFVLVLEDLSDRTRGDQLAGSSEDQVLATVRSIARLHAQHWNRVDDGSMDWVVDSRDPGLVAAVVHTYEHSLGPTLDWMGHCFSAEGRAIATGLGDRLAAIMQDRRGGPRTLVHGDLRGDNLLFDRHGEVAIVDWQLVARTRGLFDIGYHLSQSVTAEVRRSVEIRALQEYQRALCDNGVKGYSLEDCWEDYREAVLFFLSYPINVCGTLDRSNLRGKKLAETMLQRSLCAISDVGAAEVLRHVA